MNDARVELRRRFRHWRDALPCEERSARGVQLAAAAAETALFGQAAILFSYLAAGSEAPTWPLIHWAWNQGKRIAAPVAEVSRRTLRWHWLQPGDPLQVGAYGLPEPAPTAPWAEDPPDIVVVPGLVFDRSGQRLGYGGGYFDRYLPLVPNAVKVGWCYAEQVVERLPKAAWDVPVDYLLTELGLQVTRRSGDG